MTLPSPGALFLSLRRLQEFSPFGPNNFRCGDRRLNVS